MVLAKAAAGHADDFPADVAGIGACEVDIGSGEFGRLARAAKWSVFTKFREFFG